ncbi:discoidin domain-containing protein [Myxococcota bacterium]|nr:discoidin domain-containing protein [Myxococcota bacterium]
MHPRSLGALAALTSVLAAGPGLTQPKRRAVYEGSVTEAAARAKGHQVLRELAVDLDGDGTAEAAIAEKLPDGKLRATVLARDADYDDDEVEAWKVLATTSARSARRVARLEAKQVAGRVAPELVAIFEDPSPDESVLHVRILSATSKGLREIFAQTFFAPREEARDPSVVAFGDAAPGLSIVDLDDDEGGDLEIVWMREAQRLTLPGASGPVTFVIGAYRTVYRFDRASESYAVAAEKERLDFLPSKPPSEVVASSQLAKVWGTAQAFWATDDDLDTSWSVAAPKGAKGQSLTAKFANSTDVSMIRIVPGCGDDADAWNARYGVRALKISLSSGKRIELDRAKLKDAAPPAGVRALGEFPLDGGYGAQLLVFLAERESVKWIKVELAELDAPTVPKKQRVDEACISEISFH